VPPMSPISKLASIMVRPVVAKKYHALTCRTEPHYALIVDKINALSNCVLELEYTREDGYRLLEARNAQAVP
jgi:hypothetical protein